MGRTSEQLSFLNTAVETTLDGVEENNSNSAGAEEEKWSKLARIALPRLPEVQDHRERIGKIELIRKLREIDSAGLPLDLDYSCLTKGGAWEAYRDARGVIWRQARKYCPEVAEEISGRNQDQIRISELRYR